MAITVEINGENRNDFVLKDTIEINKTYGEAWTASFRTRDLDGIWYPNVGEPVYIRIPGSPSDTTVFGGIVRSVERHKHNAESDLLQTTVNCTDWNHILERRLAGEYEWIDTPADEILLDILSNSLDGEGLTAMDVDSGATLANFRTSYDTCAVALAQLASLAGMRLWIDADKAIHFKAFGSVLAPFDIPEAANNINTLRVTETDEDYANLVIGRVGKALRDPQTEEFTVVSGTSYVELAFPIAFAPTVTKNGEPQTVGIASIDVDRDWYWNEGSKELRAGSALADDDVISVTYTGIESIYVIATNQGEIDLRAAAEGTSGRYEKLVEIDQMVTKADAQDIVDAYLADHDNLPLVGMYETTDYNEPLAYLLEPGQQQLMDLDGWGAQQPNYFVRTVRLTSFGHYDDSDYQFRYSTEIIFGSLTKTAFQWFRDLSGASSPAGQRVDGDKEYFYWSLGSCSALVAGDDAAPQYPVAHNSGRLFVLTVDCKTAPSTDLVFDIKKSADKVTWTSIFSGGSVTIPGGETATIFFTEFAAGDVAKGDKFRVDVTSGGGAAGVAIKLAAKPITARPSTTKGDGSNATGETGVDDGGPLALVM